MSNVEEVKKAEDVTNVEKPKKPHQKPGRKPKLTREQRLNAERPRLVAELNQSPGPLNRDETVKPYTVPALLELYRLPAIDLDNPDEVEERCATYVEWCVKHNAVMSLSSLALCLGIDRAKLVEWGKSCRFGQRQSTAVQRIKALITSNVEVNGATGTINPVFAMFMLNNSGAGFSNSNRVEVVQPSNEQIDAPKMSDVINEYDIPVIDNSDNKSKED